MCSSNNRTRSSRSGGSFSGRHRTSVKNSIRQNCADFRLTSSKELTTASSTISMRRWVKLMGTCRMYQVRAPPLSGPRPRMIDLEQATSRYRRALRAPHIHRISKRTLTAGHHLKGCPRPRPSDATSKVCNRMKPEVDRSLQRREVFMCRAATPAATRTERETKRWWNGK